MKFFMKKKYPFRVRLEASTLCQLNCRDCFMRKNKCGAVGSGFLKLVDFVAFLDKNPFIKEIELSNNGEIFLNPQLLDILRVAYERGVDIYASNGVNFNTVSDEMLEALVKYGVKKITFSIDGASQEIYSKYRRNGNFDTVINNIRKLNEYKKKYDSFFPLMKWQYVIMDTNDSESEILKAKKLAEELKLKMVFKKTWNQNYVPKNPEMLEKLTGLSFSNKDAFFEGRKRFIPCADLWKNPQINYDGRFLGCCCNYTLPFDINVFDVGLKKCLDSKVVRKSKEMLKGGKPYKDSPCYKCYFYSDLLKSKNFIKEEEFENDYSSDAMMY